MLGKKGNANEVEMLLLKQYTYVEALQRTLGKTKSLNESDIERELSRILSSHKEFRNKAEIEFTGHYLLYEISLLKTLAPFYQKAFL